MYDRDGGTPFTKTKWQYFNGLSISSILKNLYFRGQPYQSSKISHREIAVDAFAKLLLLITAAFAIVLFLTGVRDWYYVAVAPPFYLLVLILNRNKKHSVSRLLLFIGSLVLLSFWSFISRRTGVQYSLLAMAFASITTLKDTKYVILWCAITISTFIAYQYIDTVVPFTPDPTINYPILSTFILAAIVGFVFFQIILFRNLTYNYSLSLKDDNELLDLALEEKQKMEAELRQKNEEMQTLTDQLNWIVIQKTSELQVYLDAINVNIYSSINDLNGLFVKVNDPLLVATGYTADELIGKSYRVLDSGFHPDSFYKAAEEAVLSGKTWRSEVKNKAKDGSYFWCDQVFIPIKGKEAFNYFLILGLPITERKKSEEERERVLHLLEKIAFQTSHNIRGPLTRVEGLVNLVQNDLINSDELKMIAGKLQDCCLEVNSATSDLVNFVIDHQTSFVQEGTNSMPESNR
jgi:PAS domain S-box-containing protein